jgi:hypothetical protein
MFRESFDAYGFDAANVFRREVPMEERRVSPRNAARRHALHADPHLGLRRSDRIERPDAQLWVAGGHRQQLLRVAGLDAELSIVFRPSPSALVILR